MFGTFSLATPLLSADADEFKNSVAPFLKETLDNLQKRAGSELPKLTEQPAEWFKTWDEVWRCLAGQGIRGNRRAGETMRGEGAASIFL